LATFDVSVPLGAHPAQNQTLQKAERARTSPPQNPFIDPDGWKRFLSKLAESFARLDTNQTNG